MKTLSQLALVTWGNVSREDRLHAAYHLYQADALKHHDGLMPFVGPLRDRWLRKLYSRHSAARAKHLREVRG